VIVQSRDAAGVSRSVASATEVRLSLGTGSGLLAGTLTGTIPAGASQAVISGVTYTRAEGGVALTATATTGDALTPGASAPFTVDPGPIGRYALSLDSPQQAGTMFGITAGAQDQLDSQVTTDSATPVTFTSASGHLLFDRNGDGTFGDATGALTAGMLPMKALGTTAESTTVTVMDGNGKTGSASLTIIGGAPSTLAFMTEPGNVLAGAPIPGPPTVAYTKLLPLSADPFQVDYMNQFDFSLPQRGVAQYARFFVLQDQPAYSIVRFEPNVVELGTTPNVSSAGLFRTVAPGHVNRLALLPDGRVDHKFSDPISYRGVISQNLVLLLPGIIFDPGEVQAFQACFPSTTTAALLDRIEGPWPSHRRAPVNRNILVLAGLGLAASLLTAAAAPAPEVQYWGLWSGTERGLIRLQDQYYTVGKGNEIPGLGRVEDVTPETLVVRRALTDAEQQGLAGQGRVIPDVETRRIPNLTNQVAPPLTPGANPPSR
jgi:hypothetical protein